MSPAWNRRQFLSAALAAGTSIPLAAAQVAKADKTKSPNERLNLAAIGVGPRGAADLDGVSSENILAVCDVDPKYLNAAGEKHPNAKRLDDFRKVFDIPNLDGVVVGTPDHMHALPIIQALRQKLAVYSEKPLTRTIQELRAVVAATRSAGRPTQTGNQIHAGENYRRAVDIVRASVLGPVRRVYIWQASSVRPMKLVQNPTMPAGLNYDLWLGPVAHRPFNPAFFHFDWRYWWDFGGGHLADFCCHYMDVPFWALDLQYPTTVQAWGAKTHNGDNDMPDAMRAEYHFPARGDKPPVHLSWYQGKYTPEWVGAYKKDAAVLFEGENGRLLVDYGSRKLFMEPGLTAADVPPTIPNSIGHHKEWIEAIKGNGKASSPFEYGALMTEAGLLGNVSYRAGQKKLEWDAESARATNCPEADQFIQCHYQNGFKL